MGCGCTKSDTVVPTNSTRPKRRMFGKREYRVLMIGLDVAGKTTVLYQLKMGQTVTTIPTMGFNVEMIEHKKNSFTMWDVGGQAKIRPLWRHYFTGNHALIFVVDSTDRDRMDEARAEIRRVLSHEDLRDCVLLVLANKQDLPSALSVEEVCNRMELDSVSDRKWFIQGTVATTGEGLNEGLEWLCKTLQQS